VAVFYDEGAGFKISHTMSGANGTQIAVDTANALPINLYGNVTVTSNLEVGTANLFVDTTTGNVGVGKTDPQYKLDVVGTSAFSSNLEVGTANLFVDTTTGNVGVGKTEPQYKLDVMGTSAFSSNLEVGTANLFVDTVTGNVGVGTTDPQYKLDVVGTSAFSSNLEVGTANLFVDTTTGNVGVGKTDPGAALDVNGTANLNSNVYAPNLPLAATASNLVTWNSATGDLMDSGGLISNKLAIVSEQPPTALTGDSTVVDGHGTYKVTSSSEGSEPNFGDWNCFDKLTGSTSGWSSDQTYDTVTFLHDGTHSIGGINGEWVKLELPYKTRLRHISLQARSEGDTKQLLPGTFSIIGSNDDSSWTLLKQITGVVASDYSTETQKQFVIDASASYKYYALVVEKIAGGSYASTNNRTIIGEWRLFTETFAVDGGLPIFNGNVDVVGTAKIDGKLKTSEVEEVTPSINTPFNIDIDIIGTWLNADNPGNIDVDGNGKVTKVWDETSLGNDFTVSANRGVTYDTSKRMLYFDGRDPLTNHMEAPLPASVLTADTPYCFTAVVETHEPPDVSATIQLIANLFNSDNDGTDRRHNLYLSSGNRVNSHAGKATDILINREKTRIKYIATINFDGTTVSLYVNGMFAAETTEVTSTRPEAVVRIGSDSDNNNSYSFKSWLGEAIFFTRNLTEDELIHLHKYLNAKWDIYKKPVFDIFTAAGQSNMSGRAGDADATVKPDYGREFDPQYWTAATKTPLKLIRDPVGATDTIDTASTGSCLPAFCEEYYKQTGRECIILYCAKGGSSIFNSLEWDIDYKDTNFVKRSTDILNKAEIVLENWGYEVKNKSLLWHQGESDQAQTTAAYKAKFLQLYDYWISNGYDNVFYYEISRTATNEFVNPRAAQREMWKDRANLHFVFSCYKFYAQSKFSDSIHYSPEGYDEMGREGAKYAAKVLNATRNATVEKVLDIVPGGTSSTSGIKIPYGTTDQRPTNPQNGTLRFNTDTEFIEYAYANGWVPIQNNSRTFTPSYSLVGNTEDLTPWTVVYEIDDPTRDSSGNIIYTYRRDTDTTVTALPSYTRIAYYMTHKFSGQTKIDEIFCSFDKITALDTISELKVPDNSYSGVLDNTTIQNLNVYCSNSTAQPKRTGINGSLEIWRSNYGTTGGNSSVYDYDDETNDNDLGFGSFQVHDRTNNKTCLAWNDHADANPDIGMGENVSGHPFYDSSGNLDWTFATNFNSDFSLKILVR